MRHYGFADDTGSMKRDRRLNLSLTACCLGLMAMSGPAAWAQTAQESETEEIVVTGTSIRGEQPTGSVLVTLGRDDIDRSSAANVANLVSDLPVFNSFNAAPETVVGFAGSNAATPPSLRGLPAGATLVMLNGRRLVGASPLSTVPDPTALPIGAIERIEVVPDGSSAIYGSDAVAGVMNIITRDDYDGANLMARYGFADSYDSFDIQGAYGTTWTSGSALIAVSYTGNSELQNKDRDFFTPDLSPFGGTDFRQTFCSPPNVVVGGVVYAPPSYAPGTVRCENDGNFGIIGENRRFGLLGTFRQELSPNVEFFADLNYLQVDNEHTQAFPTAEITIPDTNPFFQAPPGTGATSIGVQYNLGGILPPNRDVFETESGGLSAGIDWNINDNWRLTTSATYAASSASAQDRGFNQVLLVAAANGTTTDTALDVFGNGTNPAVADAIYDYAVFFDADQTLFDLIGKIDGTLFTLPTGDVKIAFGAGFRQENYDAVSGSGPISTPPVPQSVSAERDVQSVFVEVLIPIVGDGASIPFVRSIDLSAAVRVDDYSDFGETTNPKYGVTWEVTEGLTLRASYGTSFHAPSLADTQAVDTRAILFPGFPLTADPDGTLVPGPINTIVLAGGNPDLQPEEGESLSAGFDFEPTGIRGLRVSMNYFNIEYTNQIASLFTFFPFPFFADPNIISVGILRDPTAQQVDDIVNNYVLENFITPLPTIGQVLDLRRLNLSEREVEGIDFSVRYQWTTDAGDFGLSFSGVHTLSYELSPVPGAARQDLLENGFGEVPWRARLAFDWQGEALSFSTALNFTDEYKFSYAATGGGNAMQTVDNYTTIDMQARYDLPWSVGDSRTNVFINVDNVFDEDPPLVLGRPEGFDQTRTNPIGRMIWVGVRQEF